MPTIKILSRYDSTRVLYECEVTDEQQASGSAMRHALEKATAAGADLRGAYLRGANLGGANLYGAYLRGAYLRGANLGGANLYGANLGGANLGGANLGGADLRGAYLHGKKLVGKRPFLQIGPIGSRADHLLAFITDSGVMIQAGCFFDTCAQFKQAVRETHGDNAHAREYLAALVLIDAHAAAWAPELVAA